MVTGVGVAVVAFPSTLTWQPNTGGSASVFKRYAEQVMHWDDVFGVALWGVVFDNGLATETRSYTRTLDRTNHRRADTRALTSRATALAQHMATSLTVRCADARWRVTGIALGGETASVRASR